MSFIDQFVVGERNWIFNYILYTKGDEYARAINGDDFDAESYAIESMLDFIDL
jgi:hypothetical protein